MYCHKCGNKLVKSATFCSYCGTKVEFAFDNTDNAIKSEQLLDLVSSSLESPSKQNSSQNETIENNRKANVILEKIKSKAQTIGWFVLVLIGAGAAKVIGRGFARGQLSRLHLSDYDPMLIVSYAVPGFICGLIFGFIPYIIYKKRSDVAIKDCLLIFLVNGILGLYGGIPYSIGGAIVLSLIVFAMTKKE